MSFPTFILLAEPSYICPSREHRGSVKVRGEERRCAPLQHALLDGTVYLALGQHCVSLHCKTQNTLLTQVSQPRSVWYTHHVIPHISLLCITKDILENAGSGFYGSFRVSAEFCNSYLEEVLESPAHFCLCF